MREPADITLPGRQPRRAGARESRDRRRPEVTGLIMKQEARAAVEEDSITESRGAGSRGSNHVDPVHAAYLADVVGGVWTRRFEFEPGDPIIVASQRRPVVRSTICTAASPRPGIDRRERGTDSAVSEQDRTPGPADGRPRPRDHARRRRRPRHIASHHTDTGAYHNDPAPSPGAGDFVRFRGAAGERPSRSRLDDSTCKSRRGLLLVITVAVLPPAPALRVRRPERRATRDRGSRAVTVRPF